MFKCSRGPRFAMGWGYAADSKPVANSENISSSPDWKMFPCGWSGENWGQRSEFDFPGRETRFFYKVPFLWPVPEAKHVLPGHCWTQGHSRFEDCLWVAVCLATCPEAQTRVFHRPIFPTRATQLRQCIKAGQCLQKATLLPETEDTLSSTLRFVASQKLCQRSVGLISWLGKLVPGPREQGSSRLTDGGGVGAWDALRRKQVSADSLCVKTWVAQFGRDKRDFKEGQDDLRVWLSPRKESGICYFSSSFLLEAKGCSSSSNYARNVGKNLLEEAEYKGHEI